MRKVDSDKVIQDYDSLVEKEKKGYATIEVDARAYALAHGYDEEKIAKFVAFTKDIQGSGLSDKELAKLEILGSYIGEVPDVNEEAVEEREDRSEPDPAVRLNVI